MPTSRQGPFPQRRRESWIIPAVIALITLVQLATIRPGHDWGDDFAEYILHARNLARGTPYSQTGYVLNPCYPFLGPLAYPPVYPLLLTPVYATVGSNFVAMKMLNVAMFALALGAIAMAAREGLPHTGRRAILVLLVGLCPYLCGFKNSVLSDIPFLFFVYQAITFIQRCDTADRTDRRAFLAALAAGGLMYLAVGTRSVGLALPVALVLRDLLRYRRLRRFTFIAILAFALPIVVQSLLIPGDYFIQLGIYLVAPSALLTIPATNAANGVQAFVSLWTTPGLAQALFGVIAALAARGYYLRLRAGAGLLEIFPLTYIPIILLWPLVMDARYFIPLIPLFFYFAIVGVGALPLPRSNTIRAATAGLLLAATVFDWSRQYARMDRRPTPGGVDEPAAQAFFGFIQSHTTDQDVVIFGKPRALALFTGRRCAVYPYGLDDHEVWQNFADLGATHIAFNNGFPGDRRQLAPFLHRQLEHLDLVYQDHGFVVFRIKPQH